MCSFAEIVDDAAFAALTEELSVFPKPGLVSYVDSGSHKDMNADTFLRSASSLRGYFADQALLGAELACFEQLRARGIEAEGTMFAATGGVNTHRGSIFTLGLLAAAAGFLLSREARPSMNALSEVIRSTWASGIAMGRGLDRGSNGQRVKRLYGCSGARDQALHGFPVLRDHVCPHVKLGGRPESRVDAVFASIAILEDTNLLHRGGTEALAWAQATAKGYMRRGGSRNPGWKILAISIHAEFCARRLSPGGSGDLLAAACFVARLQDA